MEKVIILLFLVMSVCLLVSCQPRYVLNGTVTYTDGTVVTDKKVVVLLEPGPPQQEARNGRFTIKVKDPGLHTLRIWANDEEMPPFKVDVQNRLTEMPFQIRGELSVRVPEDSVDIGAKGGGKVRGQKDQ
jgi:hypothetical protein